jgi:hypothetical protein
VWEATGSRVPYIAPGWISHPCCSLQCVPKLTHTHLGLPRPGPTGSQWCKLPGYRGFLPLCAGAGKLRKRSVEQKGGAAILPCKGLDTCTPRRSKSSGLAPLLSDGPKWAHELWDQQKRCAAVERSERPRPLRTSARGTGIINGSRQDSSSIMLHL